MAAAILGVTLSNMDTGLNKCAGIFIRNFYKPMVRPAASEAEYLRAARVTSVICGVLVILVALSAHRLSGFGLFDVMMLFSSMAVIPFAIPLIWGIVIKRSPDWSAWSTVCVGLLTSMLTPTLIQTAAFQRLASLASLPVNGNPADLLFATTLWLNVSVGSTWFLGSCLFARPLPSPVLERQDAFFERLRTPVIVADGDEARERGAVLKQSLARLCIPYGAVVLSFSMIPNPVAGRVSFLITGGFVLGIGLLLRRAAMPDPAPESAYGSPHLKGESL
jgi:solute:Na+ symporter, SSS family